MRAVGRAIAVVASIGLLGAPLSLPAVSAQVDASVPSALHTADGPDPAPVPALVPAEDRIPGLGVAEGRTFTLLSGESDRSSASTAIEEPPPADVNPQAIAAPGDHGL